MGLNELEFSDILAMVSAVVVAIMAVHKYVLSKDTNDAVDSKRLEDVEQGLKELKKDHAEEFKEISSKITKLETKAELSDQKHLQHDSKFVALFKIQEKHGEKLDKILDMLFDIVQKDND